MRWYIASVGKASRLAGIIQQFKMNEEKQELLFHEVMVISSEYVKYILIHLNRCWLQFSTSDVGGKIPWKEWGSAQGSCSCG